MTRAALVGLLFAALAFPDEKPVALGFDGGVELAWGRLWRGIQPTTQNELLVHVFYTERCRPIPRFSLAIESDLFFALTGRDQKFHSEMADESRSRLFVDLLLTAGERLEVLSGFTYTRNLMAKPGSYGADGIEPFLLLTLPRATVKPGLHFYFDLTPLQSGLYWVFDLRWDPVAGGKVPLHFTAAYAGSQGFLKGGERLLIGTLLPNDVLLRAEADLRSSRTLSIIPRLELAIPSKYANRDYVAFTAGVSVRLGVGAEMAHPSLFR